MDVSKMKKLRFSYQSLLYAPVEEVYAWHMDPMAFQMLTPPWEKVVVKEPLQTMQPGETMTLVMYPPPGILPIKWVAKIAEVQHQSLFVDEQIKGPFAYWRHCHRFHEVEKNRCRVEDDIEFELPLSFLSHRTMGSWVTKKLMKTFEYRHRVYAQVFREYM
jgi:ligand-binding SRPBCC domain-containing protein